MHAKNYYYKFNHHHHHQDDGWKNVFLSQCVGITNNHSFIYSSIHSKMRPYWPERELNKNSTMNKKNKHIQLVYWIIPSENSLFINSQTSFQGINNHISNKQINKQTILYAKNRIKKINSIHHRHHHHHILSFYYFSHPSN